MMMEIRSANQATSIHERSVRALWVCSVLSLGLFAGCSTDDTESTDSSDEAVVVAVNAISAGVSTEAGSQTISMLTPIDGVKEPLSKYALWAALSQGVTLPRALATACGTGAAVSTCNAGVKQATYSSCSIGLTSSTYSGDITLTYSAPDCSLDTNGESVTRTVNLTRTTAAGGQVVTSSQTDIDYRGNSIGGGTTISNSSGQFSLEIDGLNFERTTSGGSTLYDVSARTTAPFTLSTSDFSTVTVDGGALEIIHNLAQYTATFEVDNLSYNYSQCCYPTSGTMSVSYSGAVTGSGSVSFGPDCGEATFTKGETTKAVALFGCQ